MQIKNKIFFAKFCQIQQVWWNAFSTQENNEPKFKKKKTKHTKCKPLLKAEYYGHINIVIIIAFYFGVWWGIHRGG